MGIGLFVLSYGGSYIGALAAPSILSWLYVPIIGPWPLLDDVRQFTTREAERPVKALLVADGVMQAAGVAMWVGGALGRSQQLLRVPPDGGLQPLATVSVRPYFEPNGYGMSFQGMF
jgi:hypothetical protein